MSGKFFNKYKHLFGVDDTAPNQAPSQVFAKNSHNLIEKLYRKPPLNVAPDPQERIYHSSPKRPYKPLKAKFNFADISRKHLQQPQIEKENKYTANPPKNSWNGLDRNSVKNVFDSGWNSKSRVARQEQAQAIPSQRSTQKSYKPATQKNKLRSAGYRILANSGNFLQWKPDSRDRHKPVTSEQNGQPGETLNNDKFRQKGLHNFHSHSFNIFDNSYGSSKPHAKADRFRTEYAKLEDQFRAKQPVRPPELNANLAYLKDQFVNGHQSDPMGEDLLEQLSKPRTARRAQMAKTESLLEKLERDIRDMSKGDSLRRTRKSKIEVRKNKISAIRRRQQAQANGNRKRRLTRILKVEGILT